MGILTNFGEGLELVGRTLRAKLGAGLAMVNGAITLNATAGDVGAIPAPGSPARGDLLRYNGSAWVRLPAGTAGQVLQTGGAGADPSWASAGGGGASAPLYGTLGARPTAASGNAGALYFATDTGDLYACERTGASTYAWRIVTVARSRAVADEIIACSTDVSSGDLTNAGSASGSLAAGTDAEYGEPSPLGGLAVRGTGANLSRWRGCAGAGFGATAKALALWARLDVAVQNGWLFGVEYDPASWASPYATIALTMDMTFGTVLRLIVANGSGFWDTVTSFVMPMRQWVHLAASAVYSGGTLTAKVWVNGSLLTTATTSSSGIGEHASSHWSLGSDPLTVGGEAFKGAFADPRAWSRDLTDAEVRELYQRGCGTWLG